MCVYKIYFAAVDKFCAYFQRELEFSTFFNLSECPALSVRRKDSEKRFLKTVLICSSFLGDGNVTGKFELVYEEDGENQENANNEEEQEEEDTKVTLLFCFALLFCEKIVVCPVKKNLLRVPRVLRNTPFDRILQANGLNPGSMSPESSVSRTKALAAKSLVRPWKRK